MAWATSPAWMATRCARRALDLYNKMRYAFLGSALKGGRHHVRYGDNPAVETQHPCACPQSSAQKGASCRTRERRAKAALREGGRPAQSTALPVHDQQPAARGGGGDPPARCDHAE